NTSLARHELFDHYSDRIVKYLTRLGRVPGPSGPDDAASVALRIALVGLRPSEEMVAARYAWVESRRDLWMLVRKIARNYYVRARRDQLRLKRGGYRVTPLSAMPAAAVPAAAVPDAMAVLAAKEIRQAVEEVLDGLGHPYRTIWECKVGDGLSNQ